MMPLLLPRAAIAGVLLVVCAAGALAGENPVVTLPLNMPRRLASSHALDADDGSTKLLQLNRPFYALDVRRAGGVYFLDSERNDARYVLGDEVGQFYHREEFYEVYGGHSRGLQDRWARRWTYGLTYERDRFALDPIEPPGGPLPPDRELAYPWIGCDLVEDSFEERVNQDQILRTEDVLVGLRASVKLG